MNDDIDALAEHAYTHGIQPLDWAITLAETEINAAAVVAHHRRIEPRAFTCYGDDPTASTIARRIIGKLLDAGWTPPDPPRKAS